jgi:membrane-associated phospholipid phosphatase
MSSMKTPSYPSGHSAQGILVANILSDMHPQARSAFNKTGQNISYSRRVARAHYKSDSKMGEELGNSMYKHIKNKI